jgi:photosystem II stability/assembly factor-like uncharacterized protein
LWTVAACAPAAQRAQTQYLYDEAKSTLTIVDLQFPSAARGVAVGVIATGAHDQPVALMTSDGGAHWQTVPLKEAPVALFFLNESVGWMVGNKDLWRTAEAGRSWTRVSRIPVPALRVYFADENTGWAACVDKTVLETRDGGRHWKAVAEAATPPGAKEHSQYDWIAFATPLAGVVIGSNNPPRRRAEFPDWLSPDSALGERETPHLSLTLQTFDGGKTWKSSSTSMFGSITRARFGPRGVGLGLIEHAPSFRYPSEVLGLRWPTGKSEVIYRDENFRVDDVWVTSDGACYLAGLALVSKLSSVVPQKVKVLTSRDLTTWTPVEIDYRAMANRVILAGAGAGNVWLATNNGMILKLNP